MPVAERGRHGGGAVAVRGVAFRDGALSQPVEALHGAVGVGGAPVGVVPVPGRVGAEELGRVSSPHLAINGGSLNP